MSRHLDKVLAHAERELAPAGARRPTEVLSLYKKFLNIEEHRLRLQHQAGAGGREICALRVELVDVLLRRVFSAAAAFAEQEHRIAQTPLTLIALGGYGRGELNPFSDVDVMFLHDGLSSGVPPYVTSVVEQVLYLLWDIGFKVGHSTRSVDEAIEQANSDMLTKTAMLESRYLAGDTNVAIRFREQFRVRCVDGQYAEYVALRMQDQARRHTKFGDSVYMQEPHVKSGCGGLRDYQNLLWITFFTEGSLTATKLVGKDWLSEADRKRIESAYDFLLRVRTDMHYLNGRATDILYLTFQEELASRLGYPQQNTVSRSEAFMKDYYEHTRNVFRVTERITEQFASGRSLPGGTASFSFVPQPGMEDEKLGQFVLRGHQLFSGEADLFSTDPESMMRAFQIIQERHCDLSPELADLLTRHLGLITRTFQYAKGPREIFVCILSRKGQVGRVLRIMHRVDFLGRYMPEFGPLTCLVQHEFFHRYTADEHTLVCIDKLDELLWTENPKLRSYRGLLENLDDPVVLYLALLLHDTGRGVGAKPHAEASAVFAQRAALRLQLSSDRRRMLIRLVDHHVTLSNTAQQRNIDDPETAVEFAQIVTDQKTLDALMLLTLADGRGTSADAWSDWKEALVWQLYYATSRYLTDQHAFYEQTRIERESLQTAVTGLFDDDYAEEIDAHFEFMPDNYFRAFGVNEIAAHLKVFRSFLENLYLRDEPPLVPAVTWSDVVEKGHTTAAFCAWDSQQLLARIAGSFAVVPLNILSADIYTRGDNVVLDVFR
ncbi:MAG: [protein-PII] uridylyltransferase, partial [Chthoniobacterales bacterium]